jgi:serine kinase of HPr protein (carbohydrate metabolism regulator)
MRELDIHASAVILGEAGVLIRGASGSGKSRLALALMAAAKGAGLFARLVGDDRILIEPSNGRLIARGHALIRGQIEQRGAGIVRAPFIAEAVVRLVIDIVPGDKAPRYPETADERGNGPSPDRDFGGLASVECAGVILPSLVAPAKAAAADLAGAILWRFGLDQGRHAGSRRDRLARDP